MNSKLSDIDVIVILGGEVDDKGNLTEFSKSRIELAVEIFKKTNKKILVSGAYSGWVQKKPPITEAEAMKKHALKLGVPKKMILKEEKSKDTIGSVFFVKMKFLKKNRWYRPLFVTSYPHLRRLKFIAKKILGEKYHPVFIGSHEKIEKNQLQNIIKYEENILRHLKDFTVNIKDGDDDQIEELIHQYHPFYSKKPKMSLEGIKNLVGV